MVEKHEQEGIMAKPDCQKNSPCVAKIDLKKKKKSYNWTFLNATLSLISFFKTQVRIWKSVQLEHNYPKATDKNLKFQASTQFKTTISPLN